MPVHNLPTTSLAVADDLRRAERSINTATRDIAQFLLSTLEAADAHGLSGAMSHGTVKATVASLAAQVDSQAQLAMRAHQSIERVARSLGLDESSWGGSAPKPSPAMASVELVCEA
nr:hypothetical protein [Sphingomonas sp. S2M10]